MFPNCQNSEVKLHKKVSNQKNKTRKNVSISNCQIKPYTRYTATRRFDRQQSFYDRAWRCIGLGKLPGCIRYTATRRIQGPSLELRAIGPYAAVCVQVHIHIPNASKLTKSTLYSLFHAFLYQEWIFGKDK